MSSRTPMPRGVRILIALIAALLVGTTMSVTTGPAQAQTLVSVDQFYQNTQGREWPNVQGTWDGQCVSLISQYLQQVYGITTGAWGNAVDYQAGGSGGQKLAANGFGWSTDENFQNGDILVWGAGQWTSNLGHIAIWYNGKIYDQNVAGRLTAQLDNFFPYGYLGHWHRTPPVGGPPPVPNTYPTFVAARIRTLSSTVSSAITTVPKGTNLTIDCYVNGESVSGDTIWDHVPSYPGWISDTVLLTGSNGPVVPVCPPGTIRGPFPTLAATRVYDQPSTSSGVVASLGKGQAVLLDCTVAGPSVGGTTLWDHVSGSGFISDSVLLTGVPNAVAPPCQLSQLSKTPVIHGRPAVGRRLSASPGNWAPAPVHFAYQWSVNGAAVRGATRSTFTVPAAAAGKRVSVTVIGSKAGFAPATATSASVAVGAKKLRTAAPRITGAAKVGRSLTAIPGRWTRGTRLSYHWYADGVLIANATGRHIALHAAQAGKRITVLVTGAKPGYATASRRSRATPRVAK